MPAQEDGLWSWIKPILVAFLAVGIILAGLFMYTGNWPPMVVVESGSMQHSSTYAYLGDLNIGDVVLVKKVTSEAQVQTYVDGMATGHSTYGEYGDVIIYRPFGSYATTPIIHRAILYLEYNSTGGGYNVPSLLKIQPSQWYVTAPGGESHNVFNVKNNIVILGVGYPGTPVIVPISNFIGKADYSGFVTMGDHNHAQFGENATDQSLGIFPDPVKLQWVDGIAVGDMPYVGLIKLFLSGGIPSATPANSIQMLILIIAAVVAAPIAFDLVVGKLIDEVRKERLEKRRK